MAQRRMFSLKVIDTDNFLDMSVSARELYFQFGMRADDDGFVGNPRKIMKMVGASDDDIKVLIAKKFIIPMSTSGVCVVTHWKVNNFIRPDRYEETQFKEEKGRLSLIDGRYSFDFTNKVGMPSGIPDDIPRLGEVSTSTKNDSTINPSISTISISNEDKGAAPPPPKKETISYELTPKEEAGQFFDNLVKGGTNLWVEKYLEELVVKGVPRDQLRKEAIKFAAYWTEKNSSGKKERWELQKTFEVGRRLAMWLSRSNSSQNPFIKKNKTIIYE